MTKRQRRNRHREARLAQWLFRYPHRVGARVIMLLLKRPDYTMLLYELLDVFGITMPEADEGPSDRFQIVRSALLHLERTNLVVTFWVKFATNPAIRLTASIWLKYARCQQERHSAP